MSASSSTAAHFKQLTSCWDGWIRVKHLQEQSLLWLLPAEIVPLLSGAIVHVHIGTLVLPPNVVALNQVPITNGTWVAESQGVILDSVLDWSPDAVNYVSG